MKIRVFVSQLIHTSIDGFWQLSSMLVLPLVLFHASPPGNEGYVKSWCFFEKEDIYAGKGTCCAEVEDCCDGNGTLVSTSRVDRHPNDRNRHCQVAARSDEEHSNVTHLCIRRVINFDGKARSQDGPFEHREVVTTLQSLTYVRKHERKDSANDKNGYSMDLNLRHSV